MEIPSRKKCLQLLREYHVPPHIKQHCIMVAEIGLSLAHELSMAGIKVNKALIEASCLLHDISKMESIENGGDHALMGANVVASKGFPEVAEIIRQHVYLDEPVLEAGICEKTLVNYADKRIRHTRLVSLEERFQDIFMRYGTTKERKDRIAALYTDCQLMERIIFKILPFDPDDLASRVLIPQGLSGKTR